MNTMRFVVKGACCLIALLAANVAGAETKTYSGVTKGDWSVDANWTPAGVPGPDDEVTISDKAVTLNDAAAVASLTLGAGATLTVQAAPSVSPAFADLYANATIVNVTGLLKVAEGATLALVCDPATGAAVFFKVGSFTLEAGGRVNADHAGYNWQSTEPAPEGAKVSGKFWTWAPAANSQSGGGAAHGGMASSGSTVTYGYKYAPHFAGSPAYWNGTATFAPGGGVVAIWATGAMTVNGVVSANADWSGDAGYAAPAGGSVWLAGATMTVSAAARVTAVGASTESGAGAGGGRISLAVGLDASDLASLSDGSEPPGFAYADEVSGFYCSAAGGYLNGKKLPLQQMGGAGTVTLVTKGEAQLEVTPADEPVPPAPDDVCAGVAKAFTGASGGDWHDGANWTPTGVPCANDDVTVDGVRVEATRGISAKTLTLSGAAVLHVKARFVAAASDYDLYTGSTKVAVTGAMTLLDTAKVMPENDPESGAPVEFVVGSLTVGPNASFDATALGWAVVEWDQTKPINPRANFIMRNVKSQCLYTVAPSTGSSHTVAPGYGGEAKKTSGNFYGKTYGNQYAPFLPGAPASGYTAPIPRGGGTVFIRSAGKVALDGKILANGTVSSAYTCTTGGGVWIIAKSFAAGDGARIEAKGWSTCGPGGGRIAIASGVSAAEADLLAQGTLPEGVTIGDITSVAYSVEGGKGSAVAGDDTANQGNPGTAVMIFGTSGDTQIQVFGNPVTTADSDPVGANSFAQGETVMFYAAADHGAFGTTADGASRYRCTGYVVSNATAEVASGTGSSFQLTVGNAPLTVTWQWADEERRVTVDAADGGAVLCDGEAVELPFSCWHSSATPATLTAVPSAGREFVCWVGDVEYGKVFENPLTLTEVKTRKLKPVFRLAEAPVTRTWKAKAKGDWLDASKWEPAGIPGADDAVVIGSGEVTCTNAVTVGSVALSGGATMKVCGPSCEIVHLKVARDVVLTGAKSELDVGTSYQRANGIVEIGGDLRLEGTENKFTFAAGPLNRGFTHVSGAGFVTVGGTCHVAGGCWVMPESDKYDGGSALFRIGNVVLDENGGFDASTKGYGFDSDKRPTCLAPGTGFEYQWAGSYGGRGYEKDDTHPGQTYGQELAPVEPGSPTGVFGGNVARGGGLVRIIANRMTVNGTVRAVGGNNYDGSSGGGIWLAAQRFKFGPTAKLLANALDNTDYAGGGGGRIALTEKATEAQLGELARTGAVQLERFMTKLDEAAFEEKWGADIVNVKGGMQGKLQQGGDGTFVFLHAKVGGMTILVR